MGKIVKISRLGSKAWSITLLVTKAVEGEEVGITLAVVIIGHRIHMGVAEGREEEEVIPIPGILDMEVVMEEAMVVVVVMVEVHSAIPHGKLMCQSFDSAYH